MFANESPRTWMGLCLYGIAAIVLFVCKIEPIVHWRSAAIFFADLLVIVGIWLSMPGGGRLNRKMSEVYQDFKSGKEKPSTSLQKVCAVLGLLLVIISTGANNSM